MGGPAMRSRYLQDMELAQEQAEKSSSGGPAAQSPASAPRVTLPGIPADQSTPADPSTRAAAPSQQSPPSQSTSTRADSVDTDAGVNRGVVSEDQVKLGLRRVKDPDLQLNIMDLGLVYGVRVDGAVVSVDMTLTSPGCPSGPEIMGDADRELRKLPGVEDVKINLVWAPFWTPDKIEPRVRAYLGL